MTITLNASSTTVTLHPDLYWEDEFSWYPVEQGTERTLTGALIVDAVAKVLGLCGMLLISNLLNALPAF